MQSAELIASLHSYTTLSTFHQIKHTITFTFHFYESIYIYIPFLCIYLHSIFMNLFTFTFNFYEPNYIANIVYFTVY